MDVDVVRRNNVRVRGKGEQPMLFAHGFGCDQHMWRYVAPAFERDYKVVLFDYVGSGASDRSAYDAARYNSLGGYAQDVLDVCEALQLRDVIFVGHSVSGMIGALAAIRSPKTFAKMVMVGPSPRYINDGSYIGGFDRAQIDGMLEAMKLNYTGWAGALANTVAGDTPRPGLVRELTESFCATDPSIARHFAEVTFLSDNRADLPAVPVPSLILQGRDDTIAPRVVGEYMHRRMKNSELRLLTARGHCPHMTDPAETIAMMRGWLAA